MKLDEIVTENIDIDYEKKFLDDFMLMLKFYKPELFRKVKQTGVISSMIGQEMGVDEPEFFLAGYYSNIGLLAMGSIFNKSGHLTEEEHAVIKRHPVLASEYLETKGLRKASYLAYHHHEFTSGKGYYRVTNFAKEAAFINIADVFQGCLTPKPYRPQLTLREAIEATLEPYGQYLLLKKEELDKIESVLRAFHANL